MLYDRRRRREHCIHSNVEDNLQEALTGYSQRLSPKFKNVFAGSFESFSQRHWMQALISDSQQHSIHFERRQSINWCEISSMSLLAQNILKSNSLPESQYNLKHIFFSAVGCNHTWAGNHPLKQVFNGSGFDQFSGIGDFSKRNSLQQFLLHHKS